MRIGGFEGGAFFAPIFRKLDGSARVQRVGAPQKNKIQSGSLFSM
jgi:hypothetical protein